MRKEIRDFVSFLLCYSWKRLLIFSARFEKGKNHLVKFFIMKRGRYNRPFLHLATMLVLAIGIVIAPYLTDTYPIFAGRAPVFAQQSGELAQSTIEVGQDVFETELSQKPRDRVVIYNVEKGDTLETIAKKFGISSETIKWENDISDRDILSIGQEIRILPVTGIAHKVASGETIYTIAEKFKTNAQAIVDFPFNNFANPETFALVSGQMLIVPEGVALPSQSQYARKPGVYVSRSTGLMPVSVSGWYFPVAGGISQYASWYHMAIDISGPIGTPIYAAHSGTVEAVIAGGWDGGYGNSVWINNGDGIKTHYAHMDSISVSAGQSVTGGQTVVGTRGNTGRSTGPHTHFEIQVNGALVNPLNYVHP